MARDTLIDFFHDFSRARGEFLVYDDGFRSRSYSYDETSRRATHFAVRLHDLGLRQGDAVVFWSENRPEWISAFWACVLRGIVVVPIDYRSSQDFLVRVSRIVSAKLILVGQEVSLPRESEDVPIWKLHELEWPENEPRALAPIDINRDTTAEIIFTSGATAEPKGVVITHGNVLANIVPVEKEVLKYRKWGTPFYPLRFLNLLPLSHMFGQAMATFVPPMLGGVVVFMRGYNPVDIVAQVKKRRISVVVSVPKILDVLREHVLRVAPEAATPSRARHWVRRWWHFRRIHRVFGLKFWAFVVGAAPLDTSLEAFWGELGFVVVQGYGLTETAPIVSLNHPFGTKKGSVGKAMAGVDVKIASDGEILVRGENVTRGYFNAADETAKAFEDGWFHTGDIGELDADGYLKITDRKKDLIVTAGGKNIAPQPIENLVKSNKFVANAVMLGDKRKFPIMLVVPNFEQLERWAAERRLAFTSRAQLIALPDVQAKVEREVMGALRELAKFEMPKRVLLLEHDFTIESGELTPTLKVKRRVVEKRYKELVDRAYSDDAIAAALEG